MVIFLHTMTPKAFDNISLNVKMTAIAAKSINNTISDMSHNKSLQTFILIISNPQAKRAY